MVTKQELYRRSTNNGISGTIQRKSQRFQEKKAEETQEKVNQYLEKLNQGEIKNVNQVPQDIRQYFNFNEIINKTISEINPELQAAEQEAKKLQEQYDQRIKKIRDWYVDIRERISGREDRDSLREEYEERKIDLRKELKPKIEYFQEKTKRLKEQLEKVDKGELLSAEGIKNYAESYAKYEQQKEEVQWKNEQIKLRNKKVKERQEKLEEQFSKDRQERMLEIARYEQKTGVRLNLGDNLEILGVKSIRDNGKILSPVQFKEKYGVSAEEAIGISSKVKPQELEKEKKDDLFFGVFPKATVPDFIKPFKENYELEIKRYKDFGYKPNEAKILAEESIKQGGMSFTPDYAKRIIAEDKIEKFKKEKNKEISNAIREVVGGKEAYKFNTLRETLDSLNYAVTSILDRVSYYASEKEYRRALEQKDKLKKAINKANKDLIQVGYGQYIKPTQEALDEANSKLDDLERRLSLGLSTPSAQIKTIGLDIASDFIIPGKAAFDITLIANEIIPDAESIKIFSKDINQLGIKTALKNKYVQLKESIENFFTNKEQLKEIKEIKKENTKLIKETKDLISKNEVDKETGRTFIKNLEEENKNLDSYEKTLSENALLTIGTVGFLALSAGAGFARRLKAKKLNLDFDEAKRVVDDLNSQERTPLRRTEKYATNTLTDLKKIDFVDKRILNEQVPKLKGLDLEDIKKADITIQSSKYPGRKFVKETPVQIKLKNLLTDKSTRRLPDTKNFRIKSYTIGSKPDYWINNVNVALTLADGRIISFSVISKSIKPIKNFKKLSNLIKYGTNKKIVIGQTLGESEVLGAIQYRTRAGKLTPEDYFLGKRISEKDVGIKRKSKIINDLIKDRNKISRMSPEEIRKLEKRTGMSIEEIQRIISENLTPEQYWRTGEPVAFSRDRIRATSKQEDITKIYDTGAVGYSRIRGTGYKDIVQNDLKLDTSRFNFVTQNLINNLSDIPKNKLTKSQRIVLKIADDVKDASKKGKDIVRVDSKTVKQLAPRDLLQIQSSIASIVLPKVKFQKISKNAKASINKINSQVKILNKTVSSITNKLNRINSQVSLASWEGISQSQKENTINELNSQQKEVSSSLSELNKLNSELKTNLDTLTETKQVITEATQTEQINDLIQTTSNISEQVSGLNFYINNLKTSISTSINRLRNFRIIPKKPKSEEKKKTTTTGIGFYDVFVRKKGKDIKIGEKRTKKEAKSFLETNLDETLRASGFLEKGGKKVIPKSLGADFRRSKKDPWRIIEKRSKRLSSSSEISKIQKAKKSALKKPKKRKSAEDYWFK